jgi:hypothetical protein
LPLIPSFRQTGFSETARPEGIKRAGVVRPGPKVVGLGFV